MWRNVTKIEMVEAIGRTIAAVALCLATTVFLMYPVVGQLMVQ